MSLNLYKNIFLATGILSVISTTVILIAMTSEDLEGPDIVGTVTPPQITMTQPTGTDTPDTQTGEYKDGTYTSEIEYSSNGQNESIVVALEITDGKIVNFANTHSKSHEISEKLQNAFEEELTDELIGKELEGISLTQIGGASDTTDAFMLAVEEIQDEASSAT